MAFEAVFVLEEVEQLSVGEGVCVFYPLLELCEVEAVFFRMQSSLGQLQAHIEDPVSLTAAPPDKVDCFTSLKDLVSQLVCEEFRDHHII